ncbi:MAG TPA: hypothetical protein VKC53_04000 [Patescibacteria group bacterium]|nr:hypothetical protein [Patescibacteria group bacterium]
MTREIFIHGIYPRSEQLATVTQGYERGRVGLEEMNSLQASDKHKLINLQKTEDFSFIEDGKISWQDIFRPFSTTSEGFRHEEEGKVTRWFDNNSFFRKPVITGKLVPDFSKLDEYFPQVSDFAKWKVTLPSPVTFAKLCEDKTTSKFDSTLGNITQLMSTTIEHLQKRGVSFIQLNEPYIPYHGSQKKDIDALVKSLKSLRVVNKVVKLGLHSYFGDSAPLAKRLEKEGVVDAIGVDYFQTQIGDLPPSTNYDLIAGVVDARNSDIENRDDLAIFIDKVQEQSRPKTIYITHNTDLESLPEAVALKKIVLMGSLK